MRFHAPIPFGLHRNDRPPPAPATRRARDRAHRHALLGIVGYAGHGLFFLTVGALALVRFGSIFDLLSGILMVFALGSLWQAWIGVRGYLRR